MSDRLKDYISTEEMGELLIRSDARATLMVLTNFGIIALAFALPVLMLNPLTVVLALLLLGGRQLGLAVIYHDCAHSVFYKTRWLNDLVAGSGSIGVPVTVAEGGTNATTAAAAVINLGLHEDGNVILATQVFGG